MASMQMVGAEVLRKALYPTPSRKKMRHSRETKKTSDRPTGRELHYRLGYKGERLFRKYTDPRNGNSVLVNGEIDRIDDEGVVTEFKTVRDLKNLKKQIERAKGKLPYYCFLAGADMCKIVVWDANRECVIKVIEKKFRPDKIERTIQRALDSLERSGLHIISSKQLKSHKKRRRSGDWILHYFP